MCLLSVITVLCLMILYPAFSGGRGDRREALCLLWLFLSVFLRQSRVVFRRRQKRQRDRRRPPRPCVYVSAPPTHLTQQTHSLTPACFSLVKKASCYGSLLRDPPLFLASLSHTQRPPPSWSLRDVIETSIGWYNESQRNVRAGM